MSNVNYSLKHKGVRLIPSEIAWSKGKNGKMKLNLEKKNFQIFAFQDKAK